MSVEKSELPYYSMDELVEMISEPNRSLCRRIMEENLYRFQHAVGSTYNHQAWEGGYWDHIVDAMNLGVQLFQLWDSTGRLSLLPQDEQFTLSDVLLVVFLHDIEKPWRCLFIDGKPVQYEDGTWRSVPELLCKGDRIVFAQAKIKEYGFQLTPQQENALKHVEGIRDADYSPRDRVMRPLALICHMCDMPSARLFYCFPLASGEPWGPGRSLD